MIDWLLMADYTRKTRKHVDTDQDGEIKQILLLTGW